MRQRKYTPKIRRVVRKSKTTQEEVDMIRSEGHAADMILNSNELKPIRDYLKTAMNDILTMYAKQSIYDVTEEYKVGDILKKMFFPAKKEYTMLAGEYRFIERLLGHLEQSSLIAKELDAKIKNEEIEVVGDE